VGGAERFGEQAPYNIDIFGPCFRQNPVPEIEHIRPAAKVPPHIFNCCFECPTARDHKHGIEITLKHGEQLNAGGRVGQGNGCIETDPVDAGFAYIAVVEKTSTAWKADDRKIWKPVLQRGDDAFCWLDDPALKPRLRQKPRPTVEELHSLGAGLDLSC